MNQNQFTFKTNIKCDGCIAKVTPFLDAAHGIDTWTVDTTIKDKILTIDSNGITKQQVIDTVHNAGFTIEEICLS